MALAWLVAGSAVGRRGGGGEGAENAGAGAAVSADNDAAEAGAVVRLRRGTSVK